MSHTIYNCASKLYKLSARAHCKAPNNNDFGIITDDVYISLSSHLFLSSVALSQTPEGYWLESHLQDLIACQEMASAGLQMVCEEEEIWMTKMRGGGGAQRERKVSRVQYFSWQVSDVRWDGVSCQELGYLIREWVAIVVQEIILFWSVVWCVCVLSCRNFSLATCGLRLQVYYTILSNKVNTPTV